MKLIAAVSENWGIGKDNGLLFDIPADMKFFRETTKGKTVILGRKNLESFPGGKPLKNRINIVLTHNENFECDGAVAVNGTDELFSSGYDLSDAYVIGGEAIYRLLLPYCDTCLITKVAASVPCDRYMVNLDELAEWELAEKSEEIEDNGYKIVFCTYKRVNSEKEN